MELIMFSKMLQEFELPRAAEIIRDIGFPGVDLTVREPGHVAPANVATELPCAVETIRGLGLSVPMITTAVTSTADPHAEASFATAAECGIPAAKLGYWRWEFGGLRAAMDAAARDLEGVAVLAERYGVCACLHIHSGPFLTANPLLVRDLIAPHNPRYVGAYIDPGHMTVEGGRSGWEIGIDALSDRVRLVAVKACGWTREDVAATGEARWTPRLMPLRESAVAWRSVIQRLREIGYDGAYSLHSEYQGGWSWRDLTTAELIEQTRDDLAYLRSVLEAVG